MKIRAPHGSRQSVYFRTKENARESVSVSVRSVSSQELPKCVESKFNQNVECIHGRSVVRWIFLNGAPGTATQF